jgi:hypothetical protein
VARFTEIGFPARFALLLTTVCAGLVAFAGVADARHFKLIASSTESNDGHAVAYANAEVKRPKAFLAKVEGHDNDTDDPRLDLDIHINCYRGIYNAGEQVKQSAVGPFEQKFAPTLDRSTRCTVNSSAVAAAGGFVKLRLYAKKRRSRSAHRQLARPSCWVGPLFTAANAHTCRGDRSARRRPASRD